MSVKDKFLGQIMLHLGLVAWGCFLSSYLMLGAGYPRNFGLTLGGIFLFLFIYSTLYAFGVWINPRKTLIAGSLLALVSALTIASRVYLWEHPNHTRPPVVPLGIAGLHP
jgi:hypothetical protein